MTKKISLASQATIFNQQSRHAFSLNLDKITYTNPAEFSDCKGTKEFKITYSDQVLVDGQSSSPLAKCGDPANFDKTASSQSLLNTLATAYSQKFSLDFPNYQAQKTDFPADQFIIIENVKYIIKDANSPLDSADLPAFCPALVVKESNDYAKLQEQYISCNMINLLDINHQAITDYYMDVPISN